MSRLDLVAERRTRAPVVVGLLLTAAGLGLLVWTGWQWWGTNILSQREHERVVTQLERQWQGDAPREQAAAVRTDGGVSRAVIRVPAFGPEYAVPVFDGVSDDALAAGFGHFEGSAAPGQPGNFAVAAHRVTNGEPLRDLPALQVGDEIVVETQDAVHTYALTTGGDDLTVPSTETWMLTGRPINPDPDEVTPALSGQPRLITLTTCAELFRTDDRSIAFGTLVSSVPRT